MFSCKMCNKYFARLDTRKRHEDLYCQRTNLLCEHCGNAFTSLGYFRKHQMEKHSALKRKSEPSTSYTPAKKTKDSVKTKTPKEDYIFCKECKVNIPKKLIGGHFRSLKHKINESDECVELCQQAFKNRIACFKLSEKQKHYVSAKELMNAVKEKVLKLVELRTEGHTSVKINMELFGMFTLPTKDIEEVKSFNTKNKVIHQSTNLEDVYSSFMDEIDNKFSEFQEKESGWAIKKALFIELRINKYNPLKGGTYIDLPHYIKQKKSIVNCQNNDNFCFKWSILSALHPVERNPDRVTNYKKYENELDFTGIEFPVKLKDINKFESLNKISVNVYALDSVLKNNKNVIEVVGPLHSTKKRQKTHVNLLMINDESGNFHYCWIKNLSRLVRVQVSKHKCKKFLCDGCLIHFSNLDQLHQHQENDCNHIRVNLPTSLLKTDKFGNKVPENILKFESIEKKLKIPFVVYADFESLLKPIVKSTHSCEPIGEGSFTEKIYKHEPYSFAYYIKCLYNDSLSKFETYRGPNCAKIFVERLENDVQVIYNKHLKHVIPMITLTQEQTLDHQLAINCHICEKPFSDEDEKVHDHCHLTGIYRGAAHSICNVNFKIPKVLPVYFHNLSNYDAHLFIKSLALNNEKIDIIAENKEKYISFTKHVCVDNKVDHRGHIEKVFMKIRFLDSLRFMSSSLDTLAKNLKSEQCVEIKKHFQHETEFNLIRQKGVFPYSYIDSMDKLTETTLPPQSKFYNTLQNTDISKEDYKRAWNVWNRFNCKTIGEYSDIYLKSDVLLLADVFENFRDVCFKAYNLDPAQFFTAAGLSWQAMLKFTKVELELLTDIDMLHFIKRGIRGGISQCSGRKAIANNKYIPHYDSSKPSSFINYLDATNLYGAAMSEHLPTGGLKWLKDVENFNVTKIADNHQQGYILEVDIEYPKELHDYHNDLPFCVENIIPPNAKLPKLIPNLNNKEKYIIHYRTLKQALASGLKLKKIYRVLEFDQSDWLKKYIDLNTQMRNKASNKFERDFFKLLNNSIYGKTMENVDKRVDVRLLTHWENVGRRVGAETLIAKPNFKNCSIFTDDLVAIQMEKLEVKYDKPIYVGFCVLELSKFIMYDFYYNVIKKHFGKNVKLIYTDTDSLVLHCFCDDFYDHIKKNLDKYDTSNFEINNQFGIPVNKSIIGRIKDEYAGKIIWSFYGTGAKAYAPNVEGKYEIDEKTTKKAKGVNSSVVAKEITGDDYKKVVEDGSIIYKSMSVFRSYNHDIYTEMKRKVALNPKDDKRYLIIGSTDTLAWGHYRISDMQTEKKSE